jgi:hypothetical protein
MKKAAWEKCHYYKSGQCPERTTIDKVYLIPQLLSVSEIEAATKTCEQCPHYRSEKRKYRRVARPFRVVVSNIKPKKSITGTVVDVSANGALIKLDNWVNFDKNETVNLKLCYIGPSITEEIINVTNVLGQVKRVAKEKQELAIVFIENADEKKCANI